MIPLCVILLKPKNIALVTRPLKSKCTIDSSTLLHSRNSSLDYVSISPMDFFWDPIMFNLAAKYECS